jgi:cyclopropane fatty-acyl-phospholipid synthase-like methyltransferase
MSERLRSIVEAMHVRPQDAVLEIGCGHGVAASFVCDRLRSGHLLAIDRSKKMIAAAIRRNKQHVEAGKAEFLTADLLDFDPGKRKFDKIFAVRVGLFHREATMARGVIEKWLAPRGKIFIVYDEP